VNERDLEQLVGEGGDVLVAGETKAMSLPSRAFTSLRFEATLS